MGDLDRPALQAPGHRRQPTAINRPQFTCLNEAPTRGGAMSAQPAYAVVPDHVQPKLCPSNEMLERCRSVFEQVAIRAYQLFETRGGVHGHDWGDWFKAEAEILRPVPIEIQELPEKLIVTASVIGFGETELTVSIDPQRLIIAGKKEPVSEEGNKVVYIDWEPNEILCSINLPAPVVPNDAKVRLQDGWLYFELPLREGQ